MPTPVAVINATLDFPSAIAELLAGKKLTREAWANDDCILMHADVLHLRKSDGTMHTLIVSEGDLSGTDWIVVREN